MLKHPDYTRDRIFQLVERLQGRIYRERLPIQDLQVNGPGPRIPYAQAQQLRDFRPARVGDQFRPAWATFWFRARATVPTAWAGSRVDLLWDTQSEATLWVDGRSVQGLNMTTGDRPDAILLDRCGGGETLSFQLEMACNRMFGASNGSGYPQGDEPVSPYHLRRCELGRFDPEAWTLYWDAAVLTQLERELFKENGVSDKSWQGRLLAELNRFCNTLALDDRSTWGPAREILQGLYTHRHGADARVFELSAIGHAHIDTAWLWPLAETERKCERTFSSQSAYMRDYPEYRFACSQAWQYAMIKRRNPDLYARIGEAVKRGQWVPVGGTWVEPDCNIPSGESLCRQFLFGQRFFEREFGRRCREFWNPDVFGYNGQLPQIMRESGVERFLTQKLSWNRFNKPLHHTFLWRGIDGTEVLTHFPPADTYNAMGEKEEVSWILHNVRNFRDHDRGHEALMLFGYGDGGGGPTKSMLEVLRRATDLQGLPRTAQRSSDAFWERLERDVTDRHVMWGELYFEYHRGTYTSQALIKRNNRQGEAWLHDLEFLAVANAVDRREALQALWDVLLLNQFHDILPGSSISEVYADSAAQYADFFQKTAALVPAGPALVNTSPFARAEVVERDGGLAFVAAPAFGEARAQAAGDAVRFSQGAQGLVLENAHLRATFTEGGRLVSLRLGASGRETLAGAANVFELYDDQPTNYDAWDVDPFHLEMSKPCAEARQWSLVRQDALRVELRFTYQIGAASSLVQVVRLDAAARRLEFHCQAEWRESCRMLKVAFPVQALGMQATYEMQFGYAERPTHYTTPFDLARYEVPMHRWFDFGEHGFGMAILNDCKYGGSTFGNVMRLSLLRAPTSPDPTCDRGAHTFAFALYPHAGNWREAGVVAEARAFNQPLRQAACNWRGAWAEVSDPNLVLDTVKPAEDGSGVVLRFYEANGGRGEAVVTFAKPFARARRCNVLEDDGAAVPLEGGALRVAYRPHEIISIKVQG